MIVPTERQHESPEGDMSLLLRREQSMSQCRWCDEGRPFLPGSEGKQHTPLYAGGDHGGTMCHNSSVYNPQLKCPTCGEDATYQTPDGTYWCSGAHYWRDPQTAPTSPPNSRRTANEAGNQNRPEDVGGRE